MNSNNLSLINLIVIFQDRISLMSIFSSAIYAIFSSIVQHMNRLHLTDTLYFEHDMKRYIIHTKHLDATIKSRLIS